MERQPGTPELLDQVRSILRLHHDSIHTEGSYLDWIKRYVHFHQMRSREDLADGESSNLGPSPVQCRNPKTEDRKKSEIRRRESTRTAARRSRNETGRTDRKIEGQKNGAPAYLFVPHLYVSSSSARFPRSLRAISTICSAGGAEKRRGEGPVLSSFSDAG